MTVNSSDPRVIADIVCDEEGTPDGRYWKGDLSEIGDDYDAIRMRRRTSLRPCGGLQGVCP